MYNLEGFLKNFWAARLPSSGKNPPELIYGVDDVPPLVTIVLSGLQHVGLIAIFLVFPLAVLREVGTPVTLATNILRGGPGYLNRFSASLSRASAEVRLPGGEAAW